MYDKDIIHFLYTWCNKRNKTKEKQLFNNAVVLYISARQDSLLVWLLVWHNMR